MAEGYITFEGVNAGPIHGMYRTQALANAAATDNADLVAHVGAVELGQWAPRDAYFNGTAVVGPWEPPPTLADVAQASIDALFQNASDVRDTPYLTSEARALAHNWRAFGMRGMAQVVLSSHWTVDQRIAVASGMRILPEAAKSTDPPTSAVVWINPDDGSTWTLAEAVAKTGEVVAPHWAELLNTGELRSGAWRSRVPA